MVILACTSLLWQSGHVVRKESKSYVQNTKEIPFVHLISTMLEVPLLPSMICFNCFVL